MFKTKNQKGFILIATLTFIAIASFLSLILFDMAESEKEMTNNFYQQQKLLKSADQGLNEAYLQIKTGAINCQIQITSTYELKHKSTSWWGSSEVCHANNIDYVIEALPVSNCMTLDHVHAVQFYKITGRTLGQAGASMLTQASYSLSSNEYIHCESTIKTIPEGQQSWHMMT